MNSIHSKDDHRRADLLIEELRDLAVRGHYEEGITLGKLLHEAFSLELWRQKADTWKEFLGEVGLSSPMAFQARKNYLTFVVEIGLDPTDRRLAEVPPSKLFVGTRTKFKRWVGQNLDAFLDYARLPLGEGGLTREGLKKRLEEHVGIGIDDEHSIARMTLRAFQHGMRDYRKLDDDSWGEFIEAFRDDEDLLGAVSEIIDAANHWDDDIVVNLDD